MDPQCYFLVFRVPRNGGSVDWGKPDGGLVMNSDVIEGKPVPDFVLARDVIEKRFHCAPSEHLLLCQVFEPDEQWDAQLLHVHWENSYEDFIELMDSA